MSLPKVTPSTFDIHGHKKFVLLFSASWHDGCAPLEAVLSALSATTTEIAVGNVDADTVTEWTDKYDVTAVPTVVFCHGQMVQEKLEGNVEPAQITVAFQKLLTTAPDDVAEGDAAIPSSAAIEDPETVLKNRLDNLIRGDTVMLFMKGTPSAPKCGFSLQAVELLQEHRVPFGSFDILSDDEVRQGLKKHSNWPTYPQIYVKGELQGGLDILKEMAEDGNMAEQWALTPAAPEISLDDRLRELVKRSDVMLFMKGLPSAPQCGFSRQIVELLDSTEVPYDAFDILQDEEVRQGLKAFSNWPTFPQLYVKGELVGGLDICKELQESGELMDALHS